LLSENRPGAVFIPRLMLSPDGDRRSVRQKEQVTGSVVKEWLPLDPEQRLIGVCTCHCTVTTVAVKIRFVYQSCQHTSISPQRPIRPVTRAPQMPALPEGLRRDSMALGRSSTYLNVKVRRLVYLEIAPQRCQRGQARQNAGVMGVRRSATLECGGAEKIGRGGTSKGR
jgi:hypothetical protein